MKYPFLFYLASHESLSWSGSAETIVKILHIYPVPKVLEIWQSAALAYEKAFGKRSTSAKAICSWASLLAQCCQQMFTEAAGRKNLRKGRDSALKTCCPLTGCLIDFAQAVG